MDASESETKTDKKEDIDEESFDRSDIDNDFSTQNE